jgi:hypothetical protein
MVRSLKTFLFTSKPHQRAVRTVLLLLFASHFFQRGYTQSSISVNAGWGSNQMADMKSFLNQVASSFPVQAKVSPSFPSYWFYDVSAKWRSGNMGLVGFSFSSGSTGGRAYYSDYSGSIGSDQLLSYKSYLIILGLQKDLLHGRLNLAGEVRTGLTTTDLDLKLYQNVGTYSETGAQFSGTNFVAQPTLTLGTKFGRVGVQVFAGYNLTVIPGKLYNSSGGYLQTSGSSVSADWSGIRAGAGLSLYMGNHKDSNDNTESKPPSTTSFGLGLGLDFGGIGINVLSYPGKHIGFFGGVGYALAGLGYNAGLKVRTKPISSDASFYFLGMYGYNAAIAVTNNTSASRIFYGPSLGVGYDLRNRTSGYWSFSLLAPIRNGVDDYLNQLSAAGFKPNSPLPPIAISIGYHFVRKN